MRRWFSGSGHHEGTKHGTRNLPEEREVDGTVRSGWGRERWVFRRCPQLCANTFLRMRLSTLSLFFALGTTVLAQDPFERIITMPGALESKGVAMDGEGHFLVSSVNEDNIQITRLAPNGDHVWTKKYPHFNEEGLYGNAIAAGPEGIVVLGYAMGMGTASRDGLIMRIGLDGTLLSSKIINVGGSNAFHYMKATDDGFIASGRSDVGGNEYDMLLAKLDLAGDVQWVRTYGTTEWDWGYEPTQLADGGYALVGYGDALGTGYAPSAYLVRTDAMGNELWARSISSGAGVDEGYCVVESNTGELYVGGRSLGFFTGTVSAFITKLSSTGNHIWTRVLQQGIETVSLAATDDGGVTWLAHPQYIEGGPGDYELAWGKFASNGTMLSTKFYGSEGSDNATTFFPMEDGSIAILGFSNGYSDEWAGLVIRTDADLNAACNNIDLDIEWTEATALVQPYTSLTWSGEFTETAYNLGTENVTISTFDPCCSVYADFDPSNDGYEWTFTNTSTGADSYLWDLGDGTLSEEESPVHTYTANGTYTVCLTAYGDCGEPTYCADIAITVGLAEIDRSSEIVVFPSPASDVFTVRSSDQRIRSVELIDASGRVVGVYPVPAVQQHVIRVEGQATGVYTVRTTLVDGARGISRLVIGQ